MDSFLMQCDRGMPNAALRLFRYSQLPISYRELVERMERERERGRCRNLREKAIYIDRSK
jgi:hypothetical protein